MSHFGARFSRLASISSLRSGKSTASALGGFKLKLNGENNGIIKTFASSASSSSVLGMYPATRNLGAGLNGNSNNSNGSIINLNIENKEYSGMKFWFASAKKKTTTKSVSKKKDDDDKSNSKSSDKTGKKAAVTTTTTTTSKKGKGLATSGTVTNISTSTSNSEQAGSNKDKSSGNSPIVSSTGTPPLLVLPLRKKPLFPGTAILIQVTDPKIVPILERLRASMGFHQDFRYVGAFLQKDGQSEATPRSISEIHSVGCLAQILRMAKGPNGIQVWIAGRKRIKAVAELGQSPLEISHEDVLSVGISDDDADAKALVRSIIVNVREMRTQSPLSEQIDVFLTEANMASAEHVVDAASMLIHANGVQLQECLEMVQVKDRLKKVSMLLQDDIDSLKALQRVYTSMEESTSKMQKRVMLMEQMNAIKKELGLDKDGKETVLQKFREKLEKLSIASEVEAIIKQEIAKMEHLETFQAEYSVQRAYLDWLLDLPWNNKSDDVLDPRRAEKILNRDHYGMKDVKDRILELIAVGALKKSIHGRIICLVGPPGVGKTSIGHSIATALNRQFFRCSLGGLTDVNELKGHRRTYIGAMPGKIIQTLKRVGVSNPVIMLDEIDKLGRGFGDPSATLLEILDPEQNNKFIDHYLDVPYDLSNVLFVCTANSTETISAPLLDRMDVIQVPGYVLEEKEAIATQYLIPELLDQTGLTKKDLRFQSNVLRTLISSYCRESGVRNLKNHIEKIMRKAALKISRADAKCVHVTMDNLKDFVGNPRFNSDRIFDVTPPGVVMGLAWTAMGGASLFIETVCLVGKESSSPALHVTGKLGDIMKESSKIAYSLAKHVLSVHDPQNKFFDSSSIHLHIPEGATPKDGPSAGITMTIAMLSLALNIPVKHNLAMTGEVSLTGLVLPVGGIREKLIAAKRSGATQVMLPSANEREYQEIPDFIKTGLDIKFVKSFNDVFEIAFSIPVTKPAESPVEATTQ